MAEQAACPSLSSELSSDLSIFNLTCRQSHYCRSGPSRCHGCERFPHTHACQLWAVFLTCSLINLSMLLRLAACRRPCGACRCPS